MEYTPLSSHLIKKFTPNLRDIFLRNNFQGNSLIFKAFGEAKNAEKSLIVFLVLDIAECEIFDKICGEHGACIELPGSYSCDCDIGYAFSASNCSG